MIIIQKPWHSGPAHHDRPKSSFNCGCLNLVHCLNVQALSSLRDNQGTDDTGSPNARALVFLDAHMFHQHRHKSLFHATKAREDFVIWHKPLELIRDGLSSVMINSHASAKQRFFFPAEPGNFKMECSNNALQISAFGRLRLWLKDIWVVLNFKTLSFYLLHEHIRYVNIDRILVSIPWKLRNAKQS